MNQPRIGLLPLYLELYDEVLPDLRPPLEDWATRLVSRIVQRGVEVTVAPTCRVMTEVQQAVDGFEKAGIDLLVTLHLAYSPSMESAPALAKVDWPIVLLDTTMKPDFDTSATLQDMTNNHGIHGVQDLASVLRRLSRDYVVLAGHPDSSDVLVRLAEWARAASTCSALRTMKTALIGRQFKGMGDFQVEFEKLRSDFGIEVVQIAMSEVARAAADLSDEQLEAERARWQAGFEMKGLSEATTTATLRACLGLRACLTAAGCNSFSMNFQAFTGEAGVPTVPFLEASLAMARGGGYAGEGDVLTASFVGALNSVYGDTTFTEMFCADWEGDTVFMSHMGECSVSVAAGRPALIEKPYKFSSVDDPLIAVFKVKPGPAVLVNFSPGPGEKIDVVAANVEITDRGPSENFREVPHFWIRPEGLGVADFLRRYSEFGGTHHSAIMLGRRMPDLEKFARLRGLRLNQVC